MRLREKQLFFNIKKSGVCLSISQSLAETDDSAVKILHYSV